MKIKWKKILAFKWFKRLYVFYIFGFFVSFRPSLPFFFEFLTANKHFSQDEATENIMPMLFYSTTVLLLPVSALMGILRYNPIISISVLSGIVATCLYIWTEYLIEFQVAQAFYGGTTAAELAYYVSIYAHGDIKTYQPLTSFVRAAPLVGRSLANFWGQMFVSFDWLSYQELHYFNLSSFIIATIIWIFLPPIPPEEKLDELEKQEQTGFRFSAIFTTLSHIFPNKYVVKWTIWSILTTCGYNQASFYVQPLWKAIQSTNETFVYNGVLEGIYCLVAVAGTILGAFTAFDWKFKGDLILSTTSLMSGFMLLLMSQLIEYVVLNSLFYVVWGFLHYFIMTTLYGEIAKFLNRDCFGIVFGFIAFVGWALSSGMVSFLNNPDSSLSFSSDFQGLFMFYGFYHMGISILFIVVGLSYWFAKHTYPV